MRNRVISRVAFLATVLAAPLHAQAAPLLRFQQDLRGDFAIIGNTLGHDCESSVPAPTVGTVGACGTSINDDSPDVFWRADSPVVGSASTTQVAADARSSAVLVLPVNATVAYARLYWTAEGTTGSPDTEVTFSREGVFTSSVTSDDAWSDNAFYQSTADVTALVQMVGPGAYRVADVDSVDLTNMNTGVAFASWSLVVVFADTTADPRNVTIFDGFDRVANGAPAAASLAGFSVPNAGFDARLGVIAYEGDASIGGDNLRFGITPLNASDRLFDANNPVDDFFNGTRSTLGVATTVVGDLPQLTGAPASMSGLDIDIVDITSRLVAGQTAADIEARSSGDIYYLGAFVTAISTFRPEFTTSIKTATDVNGGELVLGDELQYAVDVINSGNDTAIDVVLDDVLPAGVTYVPGSLEVSSVGALTDDVDGDQGEVVAGHITVRLGTGADAVQGGALAPAEMSTVVFRVTVDEVGALSNQATVTAGGLLGSPVDTTPTDGDPVVPGSQGTDSTVHACGSDDDCMAPLPACDLAVSPHVCVECLADVHCPAQTPVCDVATQQCGGSGEGGMGGMGGVGGVGGGGNDPGGAGGAPPDPIEGRYEGSGFRCAMGPNSAADLTWLLGLVVFARRRRETR